MGIFEDGDTLYFFYDQNGRPYALQFNDITYYYILNLQGDVIRMIDEEGAVVAGYTYDPYGNIVSTEGARAEINPLRYRGYYNDRETGFYYLNSRYYDFEIGRWINADSLLSQETVLGNNMFAYCLNNPVNMADTTGELPFFLVTAAIGAVAGAGMLATAVSTGGAGAGLALVADNISRAVNNVGTVLYSGGEQAGQAATTFAKNTGGTTIDLTVIGQVADAATKVPGADFTTVWSQAPAAFCNQASGVVNAFVSNSAYRGVDSIFWSVEMLTFLNNPRVTEIIIHIFE